MAITKRKPVRAKKRPPQWNEERRRLFLETLADCSNVAASERAAGMAPGSAYRERRRSAEFRTAWDEALCEGYTRLELALLERALGGVVTRTTKTTDGEVKEQFSDRLGMALLSAHRSTVTAARAQRPVVDGESARDWLAAKLSEMNKRLGGEG
ncbi:hypothetical protein DMC47_42825 [Nostoc sp. 3335mG]|nr:hypothetical protein DMC47_42825 [Nostoc sp. 3335mG]